VPHGAGRVVGRVPVADSAGARYEVIVFQPLTVGSAWTQSAALTGGQQVFFELDDGQTVDRRADGTFRLRETGAVLQPVCELRHPGEVSDRLQAD